MVSYLIEWCAVAQLALCLQLVHMVQRTHPLHARSQTSTIAKHKL